MRAASRRTRRLRLCRSTSETEPAPPRRRHGGDRRAGDMGPREDAVMWACARRAGDKSLPLPCCLHPLAPRLQRAAIHLPAREPRTAPFFFPFVCAVDFPPCAPSAQPRPCVACVFLTSHRRDPTGAGMIVKATLAFLLFLVVFSVPILFLIHQDYASASVFSYSPLFFFSSESVVLRDRKSVV